VADELEIGGGKANLLDEMAQASLDGFRWVIRGRGCLEVTGLARRRVDSCEVGECAAHIEADTVHGDTPDVVWSYCAVGISRSGRKRVIAGKKATKSATTTITR